MSSQVSWLRPFPPTDCSTQLFYLWWWSHVNYDLISATLLWWIKSKICSKMNICQMCLVAANVQWSQYSDQDQWWPQAAPLLMDEWQVPPVCRHHSLLSADKGQLQVASLLQSAPACSSLLQPDPVCSSSRYKYISQVNVWPPLTHVAPLY